MKRSELRENVFKLVFTLGEDADLNDESIEYYFNDNEISGNDSEYILNEVKNIKEHLEEIDEIISENSHKYTFERLSAVTRGILRVAVYEIKYEADIPNGVCASEAVKLSEKYDDDKAKSYINGILGAYIRKLEEENK